VTAVWFREHASWHIPCPSWIKILVTPLSGNLTLSGEWSPWICYWNYWQRLQKPRNLGGYFKGWYL